MPMLVILGIIILVLGAGAAMFSGLPVRLGLIQPATERVFAEPPDRPAATALKDELAKSKVKTQGMDVYLMPMSGGQGTLAYARLDASKGFLLSDTGAAKDPLVDCMVRIAASDVVKQNNVKRVAVEYRNKSGDSLVILTAPTDALLDFQRGDITRDQLMNKLDGRANMPALAKNLGEVGQ